MGRVSLEAKCHLAQPLCKYKTDDQHPCSPFLLKNSGGHPGERGGPIQHRHKDVPIVAPAEMTAGSLIVPYSTPYNGTAREAG